MSGWVNDLRYSLRLLRRSPGFTLVAVATLALGIGASSAIFSVAYGILLQPLPFPAADRLVVLCEVHPSVADYCIASPPDVEDWAEQSRSVEQFGLGRDWPFILKTAEGVSGVDGGIATPEMFEVLGITPALGRLLRPEDLGRRVLVLSHALWQSRFGSDAEIVGRALTVDDESYTVVGVLPAGLRIPRLDGISMWAPLHIDPRDEQHRNWRGFRAYGRLADCVDLETAAEELGLIAERLAQRYPQTNDGWGVRLHPLHDYVVQSVRPTLLVFLGAVGFVLLIGCANVANLLLARAGGRRRELAVRSALGAGAPRLLRLLLSESLVLAGLGGLAGLLLSVWAVDAFVALAPGGIPRLDEVGVDFRTLLFATLLSAVSCVVFGLVPALQAARFNLNTTLREGETRAATPARLGVRSALVISEVALALILLVGAGLLAQSFLNLLRWRPGFEQDKLVTVWLLASSGKYSSGDQVSALFDEAVREVQALPFVVSAGATSAGPLFGGLEVDEIAVAGRPAPPPGERPVARWFDVHPDYFRTLGLPLVRGRELSPDDTRGAPSVAMINETMARRIWPDADPIGQQLTVGARSLTVVGVVGDVQPFQPDAPIRSEVYWPYSQAPRWATFLVIRTAGDIRGVTPAVRDLLQRLDPDLNISSFNTMKQHVGRRLISPRFNMLLVGVFAGVALLLAAVGVYGVISYAVSQRTREIGVRIALGATPTEILRSVLVQGLSPSLIGILIGLVGAFFLARAMTSLIFGVQPTDPVTFFGVAGLLLLIALAACYIPARRATRLDATEALRHE